jgi:hypothetical protein
MSHSSHILYRFHDDDDDGLPRCRLNILNFLSHFVTLVLVELQILNPEFCYRDLCLDFGHYY